MGGLGRRARWSFWGKAGSAAVLVALADVLFFDRGVGAAIGVFAGAWLLLALLAHREVMRDRRALLAAAAGAVFAVLLVDQPDLLDWILFCAALSSAVLLPRTGRFDDVWRWTQRIVWHALGSLLGPLPELRRLSRTGRLPKLGRAWRLLPILALPVAGGAVFLALFATANPLISEALGGFRLPQLDEDAIVRVVFWSVMLVVVWSAFRPRRRRKLWALPAEADRKLPGVGPASVTLSLVVFNALFALQNGLDAAFLWSGAGLPEGVTLAQYAHRGAYPLIATALLAGLFVLVFLSPGSETARRPVVRRLVVLWVVQNLFLVASTMLRTVDYIEAYSLTPLRIAALAWMGLVAVGLLLICRRMLRRRSAAWLVNANALAAGTVLVLFAAADLNAATAAWNVRHAREAGGRGAALDVCYLGRLGSSALVPVLTLEARTPDGPFRDRLTYARRDLQLRVSQQQADWGAWTWRRARNLEAARRLQRASGLRDSVIAPGARDCDGALVRAATSPVAAPTPPPSTPSAPEPALEPSPAPLTAPAQP